ncbi:MAG: hypothetical protein WBA77_18695 [Microcoleaceae cyanobacterium]
MTYNYNQAARFNTDGKAQDVLISDNNAYVADGSKGLQIIDISDPNNPTLSSTYSGGNYEQISDLSALNSYEISMPNLPFPVSLAAMGISNLTAVYDSNTGWDILDTTNSSQIYSFLDQFQVSFPSEFSATTDVYLSGNYTYVADGASGLQITATDNVASAVMFGLPIALTTYDTPGSASGVFVEGNYAYVADGDAGLQIINVTDPANPSLAGSYDTAMTATDVSVSGNFAYVADGSGLEIIDISDPSAPTAAYVYEATKETSGVSVDNNYLYVTDANAGLRVLNLIDGGASDDSLLGNNGIKELMLGSSGADTIKGLGGADVLTGGGDNDKLLGGGGADTMVGGTGNDTMFGGGGSDILIGVNPYEANPGAGERDILKGNAGADTFVLGDENNIFYHDNGTTRAEGNAGRAIIKDFTIGEDIIQLSSNGTYELSEVNGSTRIYETSGVSDDYIAIVSGVTSLDLTDSSQFDTVGSIL